MLKKKFFRSYLNNVNNLNNNIVNNNCVGNDNNLYNSFSRAGQNSTIRANFKKPGKNGRVGKKSIKASGGSGIYKSDESVCKNKPTHIFKNDFRKRAKGGVHKTNINSSSRKIKVYMTNCRSLRNKFRELTNVVAVHEFDIVSITASWVSENFNKDLLTEYELPE